MQDGNGLAVRPDAGPDEDRIAGSREKGLNRVLHILEFLHANQRAIGIGDLYGMDYVRGNDLLRRGRQEVDNLSRETGETSELCMLQNGRYTIVHSSPGTRPFRISSATGLQIPLPWTASGRLLLAGFERAVIEDMVSEDDLVLPDGRRLLLDDFIEDIATAGAAGYCVTSGLVDAYTKCLAAPVFSAAGKVEATICLVVPIDTSEEKTGDLIALLRERAARLSITG
ncbi:MAG: IclR family transcriptional regulator [Mesorhizobium sp.]|nr:MAG: IclR family transcriptional regulator [Mesorhizobium sp.]